MRRTSFLCLALCILTFSKAHTQSLFRQPSYAVRFFYGSFLTRQPKAQYLRDSYSYCGEFSLVQQTDGRKAWQRANALPQVGVAAFYGNSGSKKQIGSMAGVFPFVAWQLFQNKKLQSGLRAGAGLGYIQKPYDKITNHKNVLIGTHGNAYINFLWQTEALLFSNLHVNAGLSFSHFSNGSSTLPNLGLNIPALAFGLRYGLTKKIDTHNRAR
ncbi:MAG TPA: acyloxyacyl hydrolase, partial [Chitinophagaceae bacterium]|nr:acyloxyacyl hydrolase [Chitinophagaceae bacterium]